METIQELENQYKFALNALSEEQAILRGERIASAEEIEILKDQNKTYAQFIRSNKKKINEWIRSTARCAKAVTTAKKKAATLKRKWKSYPSALRSWGKKNPGKALEAIQKV